MPVSIKKTNSDAILLASKTLKNMPFSAISVKLKAISSVSDNTIKKVAEVFKITDDTLKSWIKKFAENGVEGLKNKVKKPRKPKLNDDQLTQIYKWIQKDPNLTLNALKIRVKEDFFVEISQVGLWKKLKQLGLSYITPRPKHYLQKPEKIAEFKDKIKKKD